MPYTGYGDTQTCNPASRRRRSEVQGYLLLCIFPAVDVKVIIFNEYSLIRFISLVSDLRILGEKSILYYQYFSLFSPLCLKRNVIYLNIFFLSVFALEEKQ